jgi:hypothetical protein
VAGRQRTTFNKLQRERARQQKQAAKRARRQGLSPDGSPLEEQEPSEPVDPWAIPVEPDPNEPDITSS